MKYLCLIFINESQFDALPTIEQETYVKKHLAYGDELRESGHLIVAEALQSVKTAAIVRAQNGKTSVSGGPFAETREQLRGFYLIQAHDLNDAIRVAAKMPGASLGSIEVRPVIKLNSL